MTSTSGRTIVLLVSAAVLLAGAAWVFVALGDRGLEPSSASQPAARAAAELDASAAQASSSPAGDPLPGDTATREAGVVRRETEEPAEPAAVGGFRVEGRVAAPIGVDPSLGEIRVFKTAVDPNKKFSFGDLFRELGNEGSVEVSGSAGGASSARVSASARASGSASRASRRSRIEDSLPASMRKSTEPDRKIPITTDGAFAAGGLTFGRMELVLHHPHLYLDDPLLLDAGGDRVARAGELKPLLGGAVSGRVALPGGSPAAGAEVAAGSEFDPMDFVTGNSSRGGLGNMIGRMAPREAACDPQGRFELWGLRPGKKLMLVAKKGKSAPGRGEVVVVAGTTVETTLTLLEPATLRCSVTDGKQPVAGASVSLAQQKEAPVMAPGLDQTPSATTDGAGVARLEDLAPGRYTVTTAARGFLPSEVEVELRAGSETAVARELSRGNSVSGVVVDEDGKPIGEASVGVSSIPSIKVPMMGDLTEMIGEDIIALTIGRSSEKTAADGSFVLHGIAEEPVDVIATKAGFASARAREVKPGSEGVRIVLGPTGSVVGAILADETGKPVTAFEAEVTIRMFMVMDRPVRTVAEPEVPDGKFRFGDVPPGSYTLKVRAEGFAPYSGGIDVAAGATTDVGVIRLLPPAGIRGVVVDAGGAAVARAQVRKRRGGMADFAMLDGILETEGAVTNDQGEFEIKGLSPGHATLEALHEKFAPSNSERIKVEKGKVAGPIRIVLEAGGAIEGTVAKKDGLGAECMVTATCQRPLSTNMATPDAQGRFRIERLAPGVYDVAVTFMPREQDYGGGRKFSGSEFREQMREAMEAAKEQVHRRVTVRNGETATVVLGEEDGERPAGVAWTGTVLASQKPVPDAMLMVSAFGAEPTPKIAMADEAGRFRIEGLEPGRHRVEVRTSFFGGGGHQHGTEVTIPAGASFVRDIEVPTGGARGKVVARGTKRPIRGISVVLRNTAEARRDAATDSMMPSFAISDREGGFAFTGLADGVYELEASDLLGFGDGAGHSTARLTGLDVRGGAELRDLLLEVSSGANVEAIVTDGSGAPVEGAEVSLLDGAGKPLAMRFPASSDASGHAVLSSLAPGTYQLVATSARHAPAFSRPFELQQDGTAELPLTLASGAEVEVEVRGEGGKAVAGARVLVEDERGRSIPTPLSVSLRALASEPGIHAVGRLAPGKYRFVIEHRSVGSRTIEERVPEGASARVVLKL